MGPAGRGDPLDTAAAPPAHRFAEVAGLRLHLLDFGGDGRPIVLLHGVGGHAWMWHDVAPVLRAHGRPLALDLRGYGDSQWSPAQAYATDDHAGDVAALVGRLAPGPVDLVGFSWGGLIGLELAARHPTLVRRLAMIDIPPSSERSETDIPRLAYEFADHAEAVAAERVLAPRAPARMLDVMAQFGTRPCPGGRLRKKHDPLFVERWPFRRDDRWAQLRAIDTELLIVHAQDSVVLSAGEARRMHEQARAATLVELPGCGHLVAVERPDALAAALGDFLATDERTMR